MQVKHKSIPITPREKSVLNGVWSGLSNHEIAKKHGTAVKTVEAQRNHLMHKWGVSNTAQLLRMALQLKVVTL